MKILIACSSHDKIVILCIFKTIEVEDDDKFHSFQFMKKIFNFCIIMWSVSVKFMKKHNYLDSFQPRLSLKKALPSHFYTDLFCFDRSLNFLVCFPNIIIIHLLMSTNFKILINFLLMITFIIYWFLSFCLRFMKCQQRYLKNFRYSRMRGHGVFCNNEKNKFPAIIKHF